jgi:2-methylcitrate dehydratase PrpD
MSPAPISETLAGFAHQLELEDIPYDVRQRAKHLMLDAIGCALAANGEAFTKTLAMATQSLSVAADNAPGSGVIGFDRRLPLRDASLLNGVLLHGLDYDDTHSAGIVHLTASILPTLLGLCSQRRVDGEAMLVAYIAGIEAGSRIGSAARGGFHSRGFHPTGVVGAFASTLAAGRVIGLSPCALAQAQGLVLSMASGSLQFLEDGAWTKRMHPGWAAQAAITAATFAAHGVPAPALAYEGRFGLFNLYLADTDSATNAVVDLARSVSVLGAEDRSAIWELRNIAVKPFPVCHFSHACADAAIVLHRTGVDIASIRSVVALAPAGAIPVVCEPIEAKRRPRSDYDAKFSLPYAVASGLLRGRLGLEELEAGSYTDPAALALMDRVTCVADDESTFPLHYTGEVRITLQDGSTLTHREPVNRGHAARPLSDAEVRGKFFANAAIHFPQGHAQLICDRVLALDGLESAHTLEDLLAQSPQAAAARCTPHTV